MPLLMQNSVKAVFDEVEFHFGVKRRRACASIPSEHLD